MALPRIARDEMAEQRRIPVPEALQTLLPEGGIRRGTAVSVEGQGAVTLATALASEASRRGSWVAAVGMTGLGVAALAERNVDLSRWALIGLPDSLAASRFTADVLGALVSGFDLVLLGSGVRLGGTATRRLTARMREHGTSVICVASSVLAIGRGAGRGRFDPGDLRPEIRVTIERARWTGIDAGHGRLLARHVEVTVGGRGAASRPRRMRLWLPSEDGRVACAQPFESGYAVATGASGGAAVQSRMLTGSHEDTRQRRAS